MRILAAGSDSDIPLVSGESGVAGLIGPFDDPLLAERVGLSCDSRVLVINTEGATAPGVHRKLVCPVGAGVAAGVAVGALSLNHGAACLAAQCPKLPLSILVHREKL